MTDSRRSALKLIIACTVGNMVSMTPVVHATFGTFLLPLAETFGWSRASISGVLGLLSAITAIAIPLVGWAADRHGTRHIILGGNLLLGLGVALLAFSNGSLTLFYATFALIAVASALPSTPIISKTVSDHFTDNRGTMLGVSAGLGNGVGSTVMPILVAILLHQFGWRGAYLGLGAIVVGLGFPLMYLYVHDSGSRKATLGSDTPHRDSTGMSLKGALATRPFWLMVLCISTGAGCNTAIFGHVVPILAERGVDLGLATAVLSVFAAVCALWQIGCGVMLDRLPTPRILAPMTLASVGGIYLLERSTGMAGMLGGGALLGIGLGSQFGALPFMVARYFGTRHFGTILGVIYAATIVLQGTVPILLDHSFDLRGSYDQALTVLSAALALGSALLLLLPPYRSRIASDDGTPLAGDSPAFAMPLRTPIIH